jgi:acyl carrier protein
LPHRAEAALTRDEVTARVRRILVEQLDIDPDHLLPSTNIPDLGGDSIGTLELTIALEDEFDLEFPDAVLDRLHTVEDVAGYLAGRLGID